MSETPIITLELVCLIPERTGFVPVVGASEEDNAAWQATADQVWLRIAQMRQKAVAAGMPEEAFTGLTPESCWEI